MSKDQTSERLPDHEGVLFKKGQVRWNQRYFVLRGKDLRYWESEHAAKVNNFAKDPRGRLSITHVEVLGRVDNHFLFDVHGSPKAISLFADSEDARDIWVGKINSMLIVDAEKEGMAATRAPENAPQSLRTVEFFSQSPCLVLNMELVVLEASGEAFEKGVRVGDRVVSVNKTVCTGKTRDDVTELLLRIARPYNVTFQAAYVRKAEAVSPALAHAFEAEQGHSQLAEELKAMKAQLDNDRRAMTTEADNNRAALKRDRDKLTTDIARFEQEKQHMMGTRKAEDLLTLNIGGERRITVPRSTLCIYPHSKLCWMFNGRHQDKLTVDVSGHIFVDLPPDLFVRLVDYLRLQKIAGNDVRVAAPYIPEGHEDAWETMLRALDLHDKVMGDDLCGGGDDSATNPNAANSVIRSMNCLHVPWEDVLHGMFGFMFDVTARDKDIELVGLRVCGCIPCSAVVYVTDGSHLVNYTNPDKWREAAQGKIASKRASRLRLTPPITLRAGSTCGLYIATTHINGIAFTAGDNTTTLSAMSEHMLVGLGHFLSSPTHFDFFTNSASAWCFHGVVDYRLADNSTQTTATDTQCPSP